jgi:hypothetical protein
MKSRAFSILFFILFLAGARCNTGQKESNKLDISTISSDEGDTLINRKPAVAGSFYPGNREALLKQLGNLFSIAAPNQKLDNLVALISPHAGYIYSGTVAASAYNQLSPAARYDNIFIIGSSHYNSFDGAAIYSEGNFITPVGMARVNIPLAKKLLEENPAIFISNRDVQASEHSIEVQIPFLQYIYKDKLQIIPILLGTQKPGTCKKIADALRPYLNGHNLFVISTDFSHYPDYPDACKVDALTAGAILKNSSAEFLNTIAKNDRQVIPNLATSICGWPSMLTFLDITEKNPGIHYHKIRYMNSGDTPEGDKNRVVGYHAIAVTLNSSNSTQNASDTYSLTKGEKDQLLHIARTSIRNYLETGEISKINTKGFSDKLLANSGAFVTLNKTGALRGCIGLFTADIPLYQVVQEMAISAATRDNRFDRVSAEELNQIEIEISVLTPMHKIESINEIVLGKHGIYIKKGSNAGTFLPQVATQTGWNLQEFLGYCSRDKAGIGWDGWKEADIYVYEAYVFGEQ